MKENMNLKATIENAIKALDRAEEMVLNERSTRALEEIAQAKNELEKSLEHSLNDSDSED